MGEQVTPASWRFHFKQDSTTGLWRMHAMRIMPYQVSRPKGRFWCAGLHGGRLLLLLRWCTGLCQGYVVWGGCTRGHRGSCRPLQSSVLNSSMLRFAARPASSAQIVNANNTVTEKQSILTTGPYTKTNRTLSALIPEVVAGISPSG